jgi:hypothetical protein
MGVCAFANEYIRALRQFDEWGSRCGISSEGYNFALALHPHAERRVSVAHVVGPEGLDAAAGDGDGLTWLHLRVLDWERPGLGFGLRIESADKRSNLHRKPRRADQMQRCPPWPTPFSSIEQKESQTPEVVTVEMSNENGVDGIRIQLLSLQKVRGGSSTFEQQPASGVLYQDGSMRAAPAEKGIGGPEECQAHSASSSIPTIEARNGAILWAAVSTPASPVKKRTKGTRPHGLG